MVACNVLGVIIIFKLFNFSVAALSFTIQYTIFKWYEKNIYGRFPLGGFQRSIQPFHALICTCYIRPLDNERGPGVLNCNGIITQKLKSKSSILMAARSAISKKDFSCYVYQPQMSEDLRTRPPVPGIPSYGTGHGNGGSARWLTVGLVHKFKVAQRMMGPTLREVYLTVRIRNEVIHQRYRISMLKWNWVGLVLE